MSVCRPPLATLIALGLFAGVAFSSTVQAETSVEEANKLIREGVIAAKAGDYEEAAELFEAAYSLDPEPIVLSYIARVREKSGDVRGAIVSLERYVEHVTDETTRQAGLDALEKLRAQLPGLLVITSAVDGALVEVDGEPEGRTPLAGPVEIAPGEHIVKVVSVKHMPFERRLVVAPDGAVDVPVVLTPLAAHGEEGQASEAWYRKWWVWTSASAVVAVAGGITAAVLLNRDGGGHDASWTIRTQPLEAR